MVPSEGKLCSPWMPFAVNPRTHYICANTTLFFISYMCIEQLHPLKVLYFIHSLGSRFFVSISDYYVRALRTCSFIYLVVLTERIVKRFIYGKLICPKQWSYTHVSCLWYCFQALSRCILLMPYRTQKSIEIFGHLHHIVHSIAEFGSWWLHHKLLIFLPASMPKTKITIRIISFP